MNRLFVECHHFLTLSYQLFVDALCFVFQIRRRLSRSQQLENSQVSLVRCNRDSTLWLPKRLRMNRHWLSRSRIYLGGMRSQKLTCCVRQVRILVRHCHIWKVAPCHLHTQLQTGFSLDWEHQLKLPWNLWNDVLFINRSLAAILLHLLLQERKQGHFLLQAQVFYFLNRRPYSWLRQIVPLWMLVFWKS